MILVRAWRGKVRALLKDVVNDAQSLLDYDNKHPTFALFTSTEHAEVLSVQVLLQAKLAATRLR